MFAKSLDSFRRSLKRLKYFFLRIFKRNVYDYYNQEKRELQREILHLVEEVGERVVPNFDENRILKKENMESS